MIGAIFVKFSELILMKIIKIAASRCHTLRLKCSKFNFGWGSGPGPAGGTNNAPADPAVGIKGSISKQKVGNGGKGRVPSTFLRINANAIHSMKNVSGRSSTPESASELTTLAQTADPVET